MPRSFWLTLLGVNGLLAAAGGVYASLRNIPAAAAAPVIAAFLLQASFYLVPGIPEARRRLEERFAPPALAALVAGASLIPYLLYSLATGVFALPALLKLAAICAIPLFVFVIFPVRRRGLAWQDLVAGGVVAAAELSHVFRDIYVSPIPGVRIDILGRIMILALGALAFLSLRRLEGTGYQLLPTAADWREGFRQFAFLLPIGIAAGWATGFLRWGGLAARGLDWWMYPLLALGTFVGIYAVVALFEEFFFRGVLQNLAAASLGAAAGAQLLAAALYGLSHLPFRDFPNWRFALVSAIAGWFYGQAWRRRGVPAAAVAHALTVTTWRLLAD